MPPAAGAAVANDDFAEDFTMDLPYAGQVEQQFNELLELFENKASPVYLTPALTAAPTTYWLAVRKQFPELAEVMLFWLAHPVGTSNLERDFCGVTMISRSFRRRRAKKATFCAAVMAHCYKPNLAKHLARVVSQPALR